MPKFVIVCLVFTALTAVHQAASAAPGAPELLRHDQFEKLETDYSSLQRKFEQGKISSENLRDAFRAFYPTDRDLAARYDSWVNAYPRSYVARVARAIYYKKIGFEDRGEDSISQTSETQLHNMDTALSKAIKDFGDSISMTSKPFLSYFHMIDVGRNYIGPAETRQLYDHALSLDPGSAEVRLKYMFALQAKWGGSLESMRQFLEECRHANLPAPKFNQLESMVYEDEGWERENEGDHAAAEHAYRKAIDLDTPNCTSCLVSSLTIILMEEHKYTEAIPYLDRYLNAKPGDTWALTNRGLSYFQIGKPGEAFDDWKLSAAAGDSFSQNRLGVLYLTGIPGHLSPDPTVAIEWLRKAAEQGDANAKHNLAVALSQSAAQGAAAPN